MSKLTMIKKSLFTSKFLFISISILLSVEAPSEELSVMTLNVYGWKTMPHHSNDYAQLIKSNNIDVVGIQEGADDWQLTSKFPTDYSRASVLNESLGKCWTHKFQIFINQCTGVSFIKSGRFDLTDGPNATRTGEYAVIEKSNTRYFIINVHWDHESVDTRIANAKETSAQLNKINQYPKILLGDFNSKCDSNEVSIIQSKARMTLLKNAGIDCFFVNGITGKAEKIAAYPSDHPSIVVTLINDNS